MTSQQEKDRDSKSTLFIKYLNLPVRSDPTAIEKLFGDIKSSLLKQMEDITGVKPLVDFSTEFEWDWDFPIDRFCLPWKMGEVLCTFNEYVAIDEVAAKHRLILNATSPLAGFQEAAAYYAIFDYTDDGCKACCHNENGKRTSVISNLENQARCYECDHLSFTAAVNSLIDGLPLSENYELSYMAGLLNKYPPITHLKYDTLEFVTIINPSNQFNNDIDGKLGVEPQKWLSNLLLSFIAFDLFHYLLMKKGAGNLKRCPHCEKYFDAFDKKAFYCYSEECQRKKVALKKQRQRERNPVKYL